MLNNRLFAGESAAAELTNVKKWRQNKKAQRTAE
jgi:hypothetical protein